MYLQVTGTLNLDYNVLYKDLQIQDLYLECDTSLNPITINLFPVSQTGYFWNVKIYIIDKSGNASINPIAINTSGSDLINGLSQLVLDTDNSGVAIQILGENSWIAEENFATAGTGVIEYQFNTFPNKTVVSKSDNFVQNFGNVFDLGLNTIATQYPTIVLQNGNLGQIQYPICTLGDGTIIFECYDLNQQNINPLSNYGFFIAFRPNATNPSKLDYIDEVAMTTQFWNNWYTSTYSTKAVKNEIKLIEEFYPTVDGDIFRVYITTLNLNGNVLTATDSITGTNTDILTIYNSLTGKSLIKGNWARSMPYYEFNDDYYRYMDGTHPCIIYYNEINEGYDYVIGLNMLTGQTFAIQPLSSLQSTTNFNPASTPIDDTFVGGYFSHPTGCIFACYNQQLLSADNGNNFDSVTCWYSPMWVNNTKVKFIGNRDIAKGNRTSTLDKLLNATNSFASFYEFDSENYYEVQVNDPLNIGQMFLIYRLKLDSATDVEEYVMSPIIVNCNFLGQYAATDGLLTWVRSAFSNGEYAQNCYTWWGKTTPEIINIQSNTLYPTNYVDNKLYTTNGGLQYNTTFVGIVYDEYNFNF